MKIESAIIEPKPLPRCRRMEWHLFRQSDGQDSPSDVINGQINFGLDVDIFTPFPPAKLKPDDPRCQQCNFNDLCHGFGVPAINCRTCAFCALSALGGQACMNHRPEVKTGWMQGCEEHVYIPTIFGQVTEIYGTPTGFKLHADGAEMNIGTGPCDTNSRAMRGDE